jgi:beta-glucanase (GH16 family)
VPEGYSPVWRDEFNDQRSGDGKAALPNTSDWYYETGASGWGNNEIQNYIPGFVEDDTCALIDNGSLKIIAKKVGNQVFSIRMNTRKSWTYGYFEARLRVPGGRGTWPAFWMMPENFTAWPLDGEIDIMEYVGYRPNIVQSSVHTQAFNHMKGTERTATKPIRNAETEFHIYAVEWTESYIKGFVDGEAYFRFDNDGKNNKHTWPFDAPFYLKLNLAWGGNWGGAQGIDENSLPATYEIDYVRVYQKE